MSNLLLGIDFGASTNYISKYDYKTHSSIPVPNMNQHTPSDIFSNCIHIESENNAFIAKIDKLSESPFNTFINTKNHLISGNKCFNVPNLNNQEITAYDVATKTFEIIKKKVEEFLHKEIDGAVIAVPYLLNSKYKKLISKSASDANIKVLKIVEEPIAAILASGIDLETKSQKKERYIVIDFGSALDINVIDYSPTSSNIANFEIIYTTRSQDVQDASFNQCLIDCFYAKLHQDYDFDLENITDQSSKAKLENQMFVLARDVKESLSFDEEYILNESIHIDGAFLNLDLEISKHDFEQMLFSNNVIKNLLEELKKMKAAINMDRNPISKIILAGGIINIPLINTTIEAFFNQTIERYVDNDKLIGDGASLLAYLINDKSFDYNIIHDNMKHVGTVIDNKFIKILDKDTSDNVDSAPLSLKFRNKAANSIFLYESHDANEHFVEIGEAEVNQELYKEGILRITLTREAFTKKLWYTISDVNGTTFNEGYVKGLGN